MLSFVEHPGVPNHNNYAQYLIRIGVLKRKVSGGSVSAEGAHAYAIYGCIIYMYVINRMTGLKMPVSVKLV